MRAASIITKKRGHSSGAGGELSRQEIEYLVQSYVQGDTPDYQMAAFLMAVYFRGMSAAETGYLTRAMLSSGDVIDLRRLGLEGPFVDKHSTGGVGDKVSLPLAAVAASMGVKVPMMSGRALGITGGTLDKLEAIRGYNVNLTPQQFASIIGECGFAMTAQSERIVPADKKMYALRDVTGTVESIPLISASILSKKVAEGSDALVFDVKVGTGAFMKTQDEAESLASSLVSSASALGKKSCALITRMDVPLGRKVGNFLEVEESLECLQGRGPDDVMALVYALASRMALFAGVAATGDEACARAREVVSSGEALRRFLLNVKMQGGSPDELLAQQGKRRGSYWHSLVACQSGWLVADAGGVGRACVTLGVGRSKAADSVDADAGVIFECTHGQQVHKGDLILTAFSSEEEKLDETFPLIERAVSVMPSPPSPCPLILKEIR